MKKGETLSFSLNSFGGDMYTRSQRGFTLIEVMVVVAIIGILVAIAMPSYRQYVVRNNRTAMQAEMMQIANALERYRSQQLTYDDAELPTLYGARQYPITGNALYALELTVAPNGITWTLVAKPASAGKVQIGDGAMALDNTGRRCWKKTDDTTCDLSAANQAWSTK